MQGIKKELIALNSAIEKGDLFNPSISSSGTFWHIDHSLKVILSIQQALKTADPSTYKWKFNGLRFVILLLGIIPRGKAKAPKAVLPPEMVLKKDLEVQLAQVRSNLDELGSLPKKAYFTHPFFGQLQLSTSLRFLRIHTHHHVKIIRDISKNPA